MTSSAPSVMASPTAASFDPDLAGAEGNLDLVSGNGGVVRSPRRAAGEGEVHRERLQTAERRITSTAGSGQSSRASPSTRPR